VRDVVDQMLLEHEAPVTNRVEKRLFKRTCINTKPVLEQNDAIKRVHLAKQILVRVNLLSSHIKTTPTAYVTISNIFVIGNHLRYCHYLQLLLFFKFRHQ